MLNGWRKFRDAARTFLTPDSGRSRTIRFLGAPSRLSSTMINVNAEFRELGGVDLKPH